MGENSRLSIILTDRLKWLLVVVKLAGYVEGSTRLQKLAFLVSRQVKELFEHDFYSDWAPSKFGPFSKDLYNDVGAGISSKIIVKTSVKNAAGYSVDCFTLTDEGTRIADLELNENPKLKAKLEEVIKPYAKAPLMSLLHDVYYQYPEFTTASTIKADVAAKTDYADTSLDPTYDEPEE
jgi:uncharacterized protein YwgA